MDVRFGAKMSCIDAYGKLDQREIVVAEKEMVDENSRIIIEVVSLTLHNAIVHLYSAKMLT